MMTIMIPPRLLFLQQKFRLAIRRMKLPLLIVGLAVFGSSASLRAERSANPSYEPSDRGFFASCPNLFLKKKVAASGHFWLNLPELAVDGNHESATEHWAADALPAWLKVDTEKPCEINAIRLWTYWGDERSYQYLVEGSIDGASWDTLVDERQNRTFSGPDGQLHLFARRKTRYVRLTFTGCSAEKQCHVVEIEGYRLSDEAFLQTSARLQAWKAVSPGLHGAVGMSAARYARCDVPGLPMADKWLVRSWRGERISTQVVLWTANGARQVRLAVEPPRAADKHDLGRCSATAHFVRYVLADGRLTPDILDSADRLDIPPCSVRPVWVSIDIPRDAAPGIYESRLTVTSSGSEPVRFCLRVEVLPLTLPAPRDWSFHLDLWQNPYAVARYHRVRPWSPEHWQLLEPHLKMLADAGQKCLTTTIVHRPWGTQTYDPYDSMVEWIRDADGSWKYDFSVLDRYVEFAATCGLDRQITCYSMVPWSNRVRYLDEPTGEYAEATATPGSAEYERFWQPFLQVFRQHLKDRGWLHRTAIGMDERPAELMKPVISMIRRHAPEIKIALAGSNEPLFAQNVDDWSIGFGLPPIEPTMARARGQQGRQTTFYVCCNPAKPNTFTFSPPAEAEWLGLHAAAMNYTGFLRWAYDSWTEDPLKDTNHVTWPAGDCFLVYPNARSSIRFEQLRTGIQDFEKIRILRTLAERPNRDGLQKAMTRLDVVLRQFSARAASKGNLETSVCAAREAIDAASLAVESLGIPRKGEVPRPKLEHKTD